jgi:hypothetical protein
MSDLQRLSLGMQTFSEIRDENCLYIDKTAHLVDMIENGKTYFLSRPRRFGKSLALSTLESLLLGQKEYFEGLAAQSWLSEKKFSPRPVISMSLFGVTGCSGLQDFEELLQGVVETAGRNNKISLRERLSTNMFKDLIGKLCDKYDKRVAILIDEYDHPITEFIDDPEKTNAIRSKLQNFYSVLKDLDRNISFIFITGVTKFAKAGLFSALNNLEDISLRPEYATMCGYTQEEIVNNCMEYVKKVATANSKTTDEIIAKMESYYNGYSFDGRQLVYTTCPEVGG